MDVMKEQRALSDIERGILEDLGFTLHPLPALRIVVESVTPGSSVQLQLSGPADRWYILERSGDLSMWTEITVFAMPAGGMPWMESIGSGDEALVFRLRETGVPTSPAPPSSPQPRRRR